LKTKTNPFFSVIIPVYSRQLVLEKALDCLNCQAFPTRRIEVLVVINGKPKQDYAGMIVRMKSFPWVRFLHLKDSNVSMARNFGAHKAKGRWLVFIDSDCLPHSDWLGKMKKIILRRKKIKILGGPCLDYVPKGFQLPPDYSLVDWDQSHGARERFLSPNEYLLEGNLAVEKKIFSQAGGFRVDLGPGNKRFGFHEGTELQERIRRILGPASILYSPAIPLRHVVRFGRVRYNERLWRIFLSGFDHARAFPQPEKSLWALVPRIFVQFHNLIVCLLFQRNSAERILFRLGELCGLAFQRRGWFQTHVECQQD